MDKINSINFTGIKNIARAEFIRNDSTAKSISMVLSDDFRGNDLSDFYSAIEKITSNKSHYQNPIGSDLLNIECQEEKTAKRIYINGKYIEPNDKNLPLFSYIGKLTKKIASMADKEMIVNQDYIYNEADEALIFGTKISENLPDFLTPDKYMPNFFDRSGVKTMAKKVNNFVQKIMNNYFNV